VADVFGPGSVLVDHDYGGADNLAYKTAGGAGIDNALIKAYLRSNYDAGLTTNDYVVAQAQTNIFGRWVRSMVLDPAEYTLIYFKQGYYGPDRRNITIT
jgi:hypothetical protein